MIYKAIKYILANNAAFLAAIGTDGGDIKAYPIHPRKEVALPFCVFNITNQTGNPTKSSARGIDEIRVRVSVYDTELDDVIDLSQKCRTALEAEFRGPETFNGVVVHSIDFDSLSDDFQQDYGNRGALGINLDFTIWAEP